MIAEGLMETWEMSSYNENMPDQLDYFIDLNNCDVGGTAYMYTHDTKEVMKMEILHSIARSEDFDKYDNFPEDILLQGEDKYEADTSAEFITDNDCILVWFKYVS